MLVEFKLHNGKVPYFIKDYLSYKVKGLNKENNDRYLGVTVSSDAEYIPETLVELTEEQFIEQLKTAKITNDEGTDENVELTDEEKEEIAKTFIEENK
jgi:hypothetical protein